MRIGQENCSIVAIVTTKKALITRRLLFPLLCIPLWYFLGDYSSFYSYISFTGLEIQFFCHIICNKTEKTSLKKVDKGAFFVTELQKSLVSSDSTDGMVFVLVVIAGFWTFGRLSVSLTKEGLVSFWF